MRESKKLEFKENINSNTFLKTISAYANYEGGEIIFGIRDDGLVLGVDDAISATLILENKINDNIKPRPPYSMDILKNNTIVLKINEGEYKPYYYKGKAYKRNDSSTIEIERHELNRLILEGQNETFENMISSKQDLSFNVLEEDMKKTLGIEKISADILRTLNLYNNSKFNNAAALLADENQFKGIDIIKFGNSIDEVMERITLDNISVIALMNQSSDVYRKYYQYEKIDGPKRELKELIPEKAFREALANALIHRLWDVDINIRISMHNDKIEVTSPGGLPSGISEEEYLNGQVSLLRNPIIGSLFFRLKYIERFGTGILRINESYSDALIKPKYMIFENSVTIKLPIISKTNNLSKSEKLILDIIEKNNELSRIEIENLTQLNKSKIIRDLNNLIDLNIIRKIGVGKSTKYIKL